MNDNHLINRIELRNWLRSLTAAALLTCLSVPMATQASRAQEYDEYPGGYKPITNAQFFGTHQTPEIMLFQGEIAYKNGQNELAIRCFRQALDGDDEDIDTHKFLALSLEKKLKRQSEKDPALFDECIKEWLIVYRNERGPEKGLSLRDGRTFGPYSRRFADQDGALLAGQHLLKLTGSLPKDSERDKKYLARVNSAANEEVKGKVIKKRSRNTSMLGEEPGTEFR